MMHGIGDTIRQESTLGPQRSVWQNRTIDVCSVHAEGVLGGRYARLMQAPDVEHAAARWSGSGRVTRPARRIVSLLPSATEIVCALGLADRLVAITHECDFPLQALVDVPRITANRMPPEISGSREIDAAVRSSLAAGHGIYALDEARMAELGPDLILTQELCRVCAVAYPTVLEAARSAGGADGPVVVSLEPHSLTDVLATIEVVARFAGAEERAARLVTGLRSRLAAIERPHRSPRVAMIEWLDPLFAPGHWVPDQVERAGGASVIGWAGEPSRELAWASLADADPEIVVLGLCGFDLATSLAEWSSFDPPEPLIATTAWRDGQLWAIDGSAHVSRPGPRLVDGIEILAAILAGRPDVRAAKLT
jgi:iron complex transport system substrate-binding protein